MSRSNNMLSNDSIAILNVIKNSIMIDSSDMA